MAHGRTEQVADELLGLVLDGTYPPGAALPSEAVLAARFGVSRLTVREAIRSLVSTRVIQVRQGRPSVINPADHWSPLDPRLLYARGVAMGEPMLLPRRLLEARRVVEIGVAELAAERSSDQHIALLAEFLDRMRESHERGEVQRFAESDIAFHHTLFDAVGNVFLDAVFEPLSEVVHTMRIRTSSVHEIRQHAIYWHTRILEMTTARDPAGARDAMNGHLMQTEEDMMMYLGSKALEPVQAQATPFALGVGI